MDLDSTYKTLRNGAEVLALQTAVQKNRALEEVAKALDAERAKIITAKISVKFLYHCGMLLHFLIPSQLRRLTRQCMDGNRSRGGSRK